MRAEALMALGVSWALGMPECVKAQEVSSAAWVMDGCRAAAGLHGAPSIDLEFKAGFCHGMVRAVAEIAAAADLACFPDGSLHGQTLQVVVQYVEAHPERMQDSFTALALEALRAIWPCAKG